MKPISIDVRKIIVCAKDRGEKVKTIALWAGITTRSVYNILRLSQENALEAKPFPGRQSILTPEQLTKIRKTVELENDITLEKLIETLDLPIKKSQLSKILISMDFSFKKRHFTPMDKNEKML